MMNTAVKISDNWTLAHETRNRPTQGIFFQNEKQPAIRQQTVFSSLYLTKRSSETTISALADALVHS